MVASRERLLYQHVPSHSVYSVTFSPDGGMLAFGGGYWYGEGYAGCLEGDSGRLLSQVDFPKRTVSSVCFDERGAFLGVSTWNWRHHPGPSALLEFSRGALTLREEFHTAPNEPGEEEWAAGTPTGTLFWRDQLVVRRMHEDPARTFRFLGLPAGLSLKTVRPELTSSRMIAFPDALLSGTEPASTYREGSSWLIRSSELVLAYARGGTTTLQPLPNPVTYSSIARDAAGGTVLTGQSDGGLSLYQVHVHGDSLGLEPLRRWKGHKHAVMAACSLAAPGYFVTADMGGTVSVWDGAREVHTFSVGPLSIRTLAAHPTRPWLAVGCKSSAGGRLSGRVLVYGLEL